MAAEYKQNPYPTNPAQPQLSGEVPVVAVPELPALPVADISVLQDRIEKNNAEISSKELPERMALRITSL